MDRRRCNLFWCFLPNLTLFPVIRLATLFLITMVIIVAIMLRWWRVATFIPLFSVSVSVSVSISISITISIPFMLSAFPSVEKGERFFFFNKNRIFLGVSSLTYRDDDECLFSCRWWRSFLRFSSDWRLFELITGDLGALSRVLFGTFCEWFLIVSLLSSLLSPSSSDDE